MEKQGNLDGQEPRRFRTSWLRGATPQVKIVPAEKPAWGVMQNLIAELHNDAKTAWMGRRGNGMEKQGKLPRVRIAWEIAWTVGCGKWHPADHRPRLQIVAAARNRDYGPRTHWIEEEVLRRKPRMVKCLDTWRCGDYPAYGVGKTQEVAYAMWKKNLRENASKTYWKMYFSKEGQ